MRVRNILLLFSVLFITIPPTVNASPADSGQSNSSSLEDILRSWDNCSRSWVNTLESLKRLCQFLPASPAPAPVQKPACVSIFGSYLYDNPQMFAPVFGLLLPSLVNQGSKEHNIGASLAHMACRWCAIWPFLRVTRKVVCGEWDTINVADCVGCLVGAVVLQSIKKGAGQAEKKDEKDTVEEQVKTDEQKRPILDQCPLYVDRCLSYVYENPQMVAPLMVLLGHACSNQYDREKNIGASLTVLGGLWCFAWPFLRVARKTIFSPQWPNAADAAGCLLSVALVNEMGGRFSK